MRNVLAHVGKAQQSMASAALRQAFPQPDQASARQTWRHVADQLREPWPRLGTLMDDSEHDVLAYMAFPKPALAQDQVAQHQARRSAGGGEVVAMRSAPLPRSLIIRLIGAVLLKANDDWQMQHRYMGVEARGEMLSPASTNETLQLSPKACPSRGHLKPTTKFHHVDGRDLGSERMRQRGPAREHFQMKQCDRPPKLDFGHFRETRRRSG